MEHELNHLPQPVGPAVSGWTPSPWPARESLMGRLARLEPLNVERHAADLYAANCVDAAGRMWTYLSYGPFASFDVYAAWMRGITLGNDPLFYAIVDRAQGRAVGVAAYLRIDPPNGVIEIGHLAYSPRLQRTPIATETVYLMLEQVFLLGYRRCEWKCDALNAPSRAAAQRLGFNFEGIFRQAAIYKGRSRDTAWYAVLDRDWPALRSGFQRWLDPANIDERGRQRKRLADCRGG
jgi:RimJ/RimL family protein N-acetyltransferase